MRINFRNRKPKKRNRVRCTKMHCYDCGNDKFFIKLGKLISGLFCTKCKTKKIEREECKNKHGKRRMRKVMNNE